MLDPLRVGLEAAVAAQLLLFVAYILVRTDWRRPPGFFLATISGGVAIACLMNTLVDAGLPTWLRTLNYFIELALWFSLLGLTARAGAPSPPLRRQDALFALALIGGMAALLAPVRYVADALILLCAGGCLIAAFVLLRRRSKTLNEARLLGLVRSVAFIMAAAFVMRIGTVVEGEAGRNYRDSYGYLGMLMVCLVLAAQMLWFALNSPGALARGLRGVASFPETIALEAPFDRLIEDERIFLQADVTLSEIASRLHAPARHVSKMVAARFGKNISAYLNQKRVEFAANALISRTDSVTTIMFDSGFGSKSAFQREFTRRFGVSPTEFRGRHSSGT